MCNISSIEAKLNHQTLPTWQLTLRVEVEIYEHVITQHFLNDLQMSVWIIGIGLWTVTLWHIVTYLGSFFFFFSTFFKEDFSKYILFFLVRIIILDIVVVRLIEDAVIIMITIRILIPYPSCLRCTQCLWISIWINTYWKTLIILLAWSTPILILIRACNQQYSFVETTDHRYFRLLLSLLLLLSILCLLLLPIWLLLLLLGWWWLLRGGRLLLSYLGWLLSLLLLVGLRLLVSALDNLGILKLRRLNFLRTALFYFRSIQLLLLLQDYLLGWRTNISLI